MTRITIPYAIADFVDLRERGFYSVYNTNYITRLENYNHLIFLRLRRFVLHLLTTT